MSEVKAARQKITSSQLIIPLVALFALIVFNLLRALWINDFSFFSINIIINSYENKVLSGNIIAVFNSASELAILAMGMTLVTSASRGQDISVGAAAAIAGSVFVKILKYYIAAGQTTWGVILIALLATCVVAMICGAFNGTLVAIFKIQPMIATLILFTIGRAIAYWINGGATPTLPKDHPALWLGSFIPGNMWFNMVPTSIFVVIIFGIIFALVLKFTTLGLYTQAVGINERAARLNGINAVWIKLLTFVILGICVAGASVIRVGRLGLLSHEQHLLTIEMDAILAVAIGGNSLGGGKFSMVGSVIGAYVIQGLTTTLLAMKVPSTDLRAYKAIVIIAIVVIGSPVVKKMAGRLWSKLFIQKDARLIKEVS